MLDTAAYLERSSCRGPLAPAAETLRLMPDAASWLYTAPSDNAHPLIPPPRLALNPLSGLGQVGFGPSGKFFWNDLDTSDSPFNLPRRP